MSQDDFSRLSLVDLFHQEAENQTAILTRCLLALEREPNDAQLLEELMRAAHCFKGAARIVGIEAAVRAAHRMEDCFVAAQKGLIILHSEAIDRLLHNTDLLNRIAQTPAGEMGVWDGENRPLVDELIDSIDAITRGDRTLPPIRQSERTVAHGSSPPAAGREGADRVLRVTAANLNRLLGLAGEALVESRWLVPYADSLLRLKRRHRKLSRTLESLCEALAGADLKETAQTRLEEALRQSASCTRELAAKYADLDLFVHRSTSLSHRFYDEVLASRMRPFSDGVQGFPRMVRDLARKLGKEVKLEISGESIQVDRDVLEKLEAPLTHLLRNAVDHGVEPPAVREQLGKPREAALCLEARHAAGLLLIVVEDDGCGIALDGLRRAIVEKMLTTAEVAEKLSEEELLDFLFLPGFSMREKVTETSGRGVGLDIVRNMAKAVGGNALIQSNFGRGVRFQLQLPLALSVMRALLVEVAGEPYAFPLVRIHGTLRAPRAAIETLEGRDHVNFGGRRVGLVAACQVLDRGSVLPGDELPVVILGDANKRFGLVVDKFLGERQIVVQPLDPRLGKIKDISAAALMPDGSPVLILDIDDLMHSIESLVAGGELGKLQPGGVNDGGKPPKRVLVVDDSLTVRELERKLLGNAGYAVDAAVDGMDGWNAVRTQAYDLVVTDIDMPRMDGIELVRLIKKDPRMNALPVMVVSYKDRPEDRERGLEAGADYYLTKGSFHDETLLNAVAELIGAPCE